VNKQDQAVLTCPQCGHQQPVSRAAFSANCKKCNRYLRVQDLLNPAPKRAEPPPQQKQIACFDCGTQFEVPATAHSTMCKRCSSYIDLHDYNITNAVSKNFKTKGIFVVQPSGYVFNTEAMVREAVIKGRFLGKLIVERSLTIYSTAEIKGSFAAAQLIIPPANHFRWSNEIKVDAAEIEGELQANLNVRLLVVKPRGRLFGNVKAKSVAVESGGVLVGEARIGARER
jgi:cytoskeletal protein CcmA (bactofilin family)